MEKSRHKDPLLATARFVIVILKVLFALSGAAVAVAIPVFLYYRGEVEAHLLPSAAGNGGPVMAMIVALALTGIAVFALVFHFVQLLGRIIASVSEGDPFIPANADRLARMGWITLIIQGVGIPMGVLAGILAHQFPEGAVKYDSVFSLNGLVLALVLFILARVFRQGTAMRDDLEGTV
jgi:hypothetical protein